MLLVTEVIYYIAASLAVGVGAYFFEELDRPCQAAITHIYTSFTTTVYSLGLFCVTVLLPLNDAFSLPMGASVGRRVAPLVSLFLACKLVAVKLDTAHKILLCS